MKLYFFEKYMYIQWLNLELNWSSSTFKKWERPKHLYHFHLACLQNLTNLSIFIGILYKDSSYKTYRTLFWNNMHRLTLSRIASEIHICEFMVKRYFVQHFFVNLLIFMLFTRRNKYMWKYIYENSEHASLVIIGDSSGQLKTCLKFTLFIRALLILKYMKTNVLPELCDCNTSRGVTNNSPRKPPLNLKSLSDLVYSLCRAIINVLD